MLREAQSMPSARPLFVATPSRSPQVARAAASAQPTSLTAAQAVAAWKAGQNTKSVVIRDSAAQIKSQFADLKAIANASKIASISFTDAQRPTLSFAASDMVGIGTTPLLAKLSAATIEIKDTAANIKANFQSITTNASRIAQITSNDNGRPTLNLSATEYKSAQGFLPKIKNTSIAVQLTGARNQYIVKTATDGSVITTDLNKRLNESQVFKGVHFLKFSDVTTVGTSGNKSIDALIRPGTPNWWSGQPADVTSSTTTVAPAAYALEAGSSKTKLTYSFMGNTPPAGATAGDKNGWAEMNQVQKQAVDDAFTYLSNLINVEFEKSNNTDGSADINFATNNQNKISAGYANPPKASGSHNVFVMIAKDATSNDITQYPNTFDPGGYGWQTLIHEIGHALGLKHPGNYNAGGGGTEPPYLPSSLDSQRNTVMSYKGAPDNTVVEKTGNQLKTKTINPSTYMSLDIAALQFLYGKNASGDVADFQVTTFSNNWTGLQTLWSPSGISLDASATSKSNIIDLREGAYSSINVITDKKTYLASFGNTTFATKYNTNFGLNNVGLAYGSQYKEIVGGSANDTFFSSFYDAKINGGAGTDTLHLSGKASDWNFTLLANNTIINNKDGSIGITGSGEITNSSTNTKLTISGIEKIKFYNPLSKPSLHTAIDISA